MMAASSHHGLGITLALTAGTMAALASVCAKFAMSADVVHHLCEEVVDSVPLSGSLGIICESVSNVLRILCFGSIFVFNALMWTFYTKSLQYLPSTVEATITNTGANFLVTAVVGVALFGERLSLLWWMGSCLILAGLIFIHKGTAESEEVKEQKVK